MIYNRLLKILFVITLLVGIPAFAVEQASVSYEDVQVDYSVIEAYNTTVEADNFFNQYLKTNDKRLLTSAAAKYYILTKKTPGDIYPFLQLARAYDALGKDRLAKEYFNKAYNINNSNPYVSYYFGDYYFNRNKYGKALKQYLIAFDCGMFSSADLNMKIATIYEKLADLKKAEYHYSMVVRFDKTNKIAKDKMTKLNTLNSVKDGK